MTKYLVAERFKSLQGEGVYAGTPMAFIRFVGCSVGKKICQHCDTVFEKMLPWQGGGSFSPGELHDWVQGPPPYEHVCLTGGEPLDQQLTDLLDCFAQRSAPMIHLETSGTKVEELLQHFKVLCDTSSLKSWICVSPKPGFLEEAVLAADEVKVIVPGLGTPESLRALRVATERALLVGTVTHQGPPPGHEYATRDDFRWPELSDALRWADNGKIVFLQPRNETLSVDMHNLMIVQDILRDHPNLRLSVQMHKILKVQ